jgi:hypothetical protein
MSAYVVHPADDFGRQGGREPQILRHSANYPPNYINCSTLDSIWCRAYYKGYKVLHEKAVVCQPLFTTKVGVLRASHNIFNSEVRICWNDVSTFSSISSSQLTFCCVSKISWHDQRYSGQRVGRISAHYIALLIVSWFKNQWVLVATLSPFISQKSQNSTVLL